MLLLRLLAPVNKAVVADEVRSLAQKTQESTSSIRDMIERLEESSKTALESMEANQERVKETSEHINNSDESVLKSSQKIENVKQLVTLTSTITAEQVEAIEDINNSIELLESNTKETFTSLAEADELRKSLAIQVEKLDSKIQHFNCE